MEVRLFTDCPGYGVTSPGAQSEAMIGPARDQPANIPRDGVHVLDFFLGRVGVVHPEVADALELAGNAEIEADRLGMTDVQVTVRFGREPGDNLLVNARFEVGCDDIPDEIRWFLRGGGWILSGCGEGGIRPG
jgi:hypothetical protein